MWLTRSAVFSGGPDSAYITGMHSSRLFIRLITLEFVPWSIDRQPEAEI
jgi:hypothetical protein